MQLLQVAPHPHRLFHLGLHPRLPLDALPRCKDRPYRLYSCVLYICTGLLQVKSCALRHRRLGDVLKDTAWSYHRAPGIGPLHMMHIKAWRLFISSTSRLQAKAQVTEEITITEETA